jgi:hypothetical protein
MDLRVKPEDDRKIELRHRLRIILFGINQFQGYALDSTNHNM